MSSSGKLGLWPVVAIGVGGMVGGGIFAVLGLAVQLAHGGTPLAFAIAGGVALLTAYSYVKLSLAYPGRGGTVTFLNRAFGANYLTGTLNVLLWLSYIVMLSLYSYAFGSYGATFLPDRWQGLGAHLLTSAAIVLIAGLNVLSATIIGRAENWIVGLKIAILALFVGVGAFGIDSSSLAPAAWAPLLQVAAGGMIIFLAYEGFELIANTADDVADPHRTLPRAFFIAVGFVVVLYVAVAAVTVGNLSVDSIVAAKDFALAEAAKPFLGQAGFTMIAIAAMLSTASAINATLYGSARLSYSIVRAHELPQALGRRLWGRDIEGLLITAAVTLVVANTLDLGSIATIGSAGFLVIFAAVNVASAVRSRDVASRAWLSWVAAAACVVALGALIWQTAQDDAQNLSVLLGLVGLAAGIEAVFRLTERAELRLE
ncbi:APC family permease [Demequina sp. SYSU T00068]|uniref:APC family permease n=1 Tax=Demequina lignilytica TaxID=3051663 RepID=UPI002634862B|nr:APC family permease [Demequina sp. SYSU T00068]MDN4491043.1 APC family permease [Demequina sp. SYSU T00068]